MKPHLTGRLAVLLVLVMPSGLMALGPVAPPATGLDWPHQTANRATLPDCRSQSNRVSRSAPNKACAEAWLGELSVAIGGASEGVSTAAARPDLTIQAGPSVASTERLRREL